MHEKFSEVNYGSFYGTCEISDSETIGNCTDYLLSQLDEIDNGSQSTLILYLAALLDSGHITDSIRIDKILLVLERQLVSIDDYRAFDECGELIHLFNHVLVLGESVLESLNLDIDGRKRVGKLALEAYVSSPIPLCFNEDISVANILAKSSLQEEDVITSLSSLTPVVPVEGEDLRGYAHREFNKRLLWQTIHSLSFFEDNILKSTIDGLRKKTQALHLG